MKRSTTLLLIMIAALLVIAAAEQRVIDQRAREHIKTADEITASCVAFGYFEWKGNIYNCELAEQSATTDA